MDFFVVPIVLAWYWLTDFRTIRHQKLYKEMAVALGILAMALGMIAMAHLLRKPPSPMLWITSVFEPISKWMEQKMK